MLNPEYDYQVWNVITKDGMWLPRAEFDYQVRNRITKCRMELPSAECDYQVRNLITKCGMELPSAECDYQVRNLITKCRIRRAFHSRVAKASMLLWGCGKPCSADWVRKSTRIRSSAGVRFCWALWASCMLRPPLYLLTIVLHCLAMLKSSAIFCAPLRTLAGRACSLSS